MRDPAAGGAALREPSALGCGGVTLGFSGSLVPPLFAWQSGRMTDGDCMLFDLCMALPKLPPGILRDLGKRRLPSDELAEKIVGQVILEHLQLCGWRLEHKPGHTVTPAR